ncbi:MAG TPA: hypothetical protein VJ908_08965 [Wenzhouxiangellaceae bacterium]|nr:hypothetical protein [Wenzhouxiangellaceae bacterium]
MNHEGHEEHEVKNMNPEKNPPVIPESPAGDIRDLETPAPIQKGGNVERFRIELSHFRNDEQFSVLSARPSWLKPDFAFPVKTEF